MKKLIIIITTLIVASLSPTYATAAPQLNIPLNFKHINIEPLAVFDCFDSVNVGKIGTAGECLGLMVVDNAMLRQAATNGSDLTVIFTGQVTDMSHMFVMNNTFNQDISGWNTFNVYDMTGMFRDNDEFNQDISSWNTSNVNYFNEMFFNNSIFNQDISSWNTSNHIDKSNMFEMSLMVSFPEKQPTF
jgi:surface protein